jgi:hypothetical protein
VPADSFHSIQRFVAGLGKHRRVFKQFDHARFVKVPRSLPRTGEYFNPAQVSGLYRRSKPLFLRAAVIDLISA